MDTIKAETSYRDYIKTLEKQSSKRTARSEVPSDRGTEQKGRGFKPKFSVILMKLSPSLVFISLTTIGLSLIMPVKANAQLRNIGPNISVPPRQCIPGAVNCGAEIHRENMRHNRQIYFQTPEKILQHFHRERTERACLERTITSPPPAINANCNQYLDRIETLNQQDAVIDQRLLQQQEIDRLYPNGSNF